MKKYFANFYNNYLTAEVYNIIKFLYIYIPLCVRERDIDPCKRSISVTNLKWMLNKNGAVPNKLQNGRQISIDSQ